MTEKIPGINPDLDRMPSEGHAMSDTMTNEAALIKALKSVESERDALQARCDELEAAAREACEQLKSLAYASHKATGRPLSKRPRTKMLQRPEKVRDNLLAVRKALRSVVDGGE